LEKKSNIKVENWKAGGAKIQPSFPGNSCSVSAAMLNFCSHSTPKNGLIQVFRFIRLLDLEFCDFFYFFYGLISEVVG
jgi:hypothetical protein